MRVLLLLVCSLALRAQAPDFQQRTRAAIDLYAHPKSPGALGYLNIAAKLKVREDAALCSRRLEELLAEGPTGDMFWMFPITAVAYLDRGQLTRFRTAGSAIVVQDLHALSRATRRITGCSTTRRCT